jgi:hypothetical protein
MVEAGESDNFSSGGRKFNNGEDNLGDILKLLNVSPMLVTGSHQYHLEFPCARVITHTFAVSFTPI